MNHNECQHIHINYISCIYSCAPHISIETDESDQTKWVASRQASRQAITKQHQDSLDLLVSILNRESNELFIHLSLECRRLFSSLLFTFDCVLWSIFLLENLLRCAINCRALLLWGISHICERECFACFFHRFIYLFIYLRSTFFYLISRFAVVINNKLK